MLLLKPKLIKILSTVDKKKLSRATNGGFKVTAILLITMSEPIGRQNASTSYYLSLIHI